MKLFSFSIWIIATRIIDLICTYLYTPDLKNEASFIISVLGFQWIVFIVFNLALVFSVLYCRKRTSASEIDLYPKNINGNFITYLGCILVGKSTSNSAVVLPPSA